jgi:hypothetical protein
MNINNDIIILKELLNKQKQNIISNKLEYKDLKRISTNIESSIFDSEKCSLWKGSCININNKKYVNFYYCGKKKSIQRLIYNNYVDNIEDTRYIHYMCSNKGLCCNINHFTVKNNEIKKKSKMKDESIKNNEKNNEKNNDNLNENVNDINNKNEKNKLKKNDFEYESISDIAKKKYYL